MPREKLSPSERRSLVLAALSGKPKAQLAETYGVARSYIYALVEEATTDAAGKLKEAQADVAFRRKVLETVEAAEWVEEIMMRS